MPWPAFLALIGQAASAVGSAGAAAGSALGSAASTVGGALGSAAGGIGDTLVSSLGAGGGGGAAIGGPATEAAGALGAPAGPATAAGAFPAAGATSSAPGLGGTLLQAGGKLATGDVLGGTSELLRAGNLPGSQTLSDLGKFTRGVSTAPSPYGQAGKEPDSYPLGSPMKQLNKNTIQGVFARRGDTDARMVRRPPPTGDTGIYRPDQLTVGWPYDYGIRGRAY